jgi:hypothetical protein
MQNGVLSKVEHFTDIQREPGTAFHACFDLLEFTHYGRDLFF